MQQKVFALIVSAVALLLTCSCSGSDENDLISTAESIRGYWIDNQNDFALEIISEDDYFKRENGNSSRNLYQLWYIGGSTPKLYVAWTTQTDVFNFHNPDYTWHDDVSILWAEQDRLVLDGNDMYSFTRVTKDYFDKLVNRSSGNSSGNNSGNDETLTLSQVKSRSQINVAYNNYRFKITTTYSPINGESASFNWCVSRRGSETGYEFTGKDIKSSIATSGGNKVFILEFPFYLYFSIRAKEANNSWESDDWIDKWVTAEDYLASYDVLNQKEAAGQKLDSYELQLRKDCITILDKLTREITYDFSLWIYVIIKGKTYNLGETYLR